MRGKVQIAISPQVRTERQFLTGGKIEGGEGHLPFRRRECCKNMIGFLACKTQPCQPSLHPGDGRNRHGAPQSRYV